MFMYKKNQLTIVSSFLVLVFYASQAQCSLISKCFALLCFLSASTYIFIFYRSESQHNRPDAWRKSEFREDNIPLVSVSEDFISWTRWWLTRNIREGMSLSIFVNRWIPAIFHSWVDWFFEKSIFKTKKIYRRTAS